MLDRVPETLQLAKDSADNIIIGEDDGTIDRSHYDKDGVHYFDQDSEFYDDIFSELMDDNLTPANLLGMKGASFRTQAKKAKDARLYLGDEDLARFERSVVRDVEELLAVAPSSPPSAAASATASATADSSFVVPDAIDQKLNNLIRKKVHSKKVEIRERKRQLLLGVSHSNNDDVDGDAKDEEEEEEEEEERNKRMISLKNEFQNFVHPSNILTYLLETIKLPNLSSIPPKTFTAVIQSCPNVDVAMKLVDQLVAPNNKNAEDILTSRISSVLVSLATQNSDIESALTILRSFHYKYPTAKPSREAYTTLIWECAKVSERAVNKNLSFVRGQSLTFLKSADY